MDTIQIDILNPEVKKILKNLADLNLIAIRDKPKNEFPELLKKLRSEDSDKPSIEDITKEVELVRSKRYERSTH